MLQLQWSSVTIQSNTQANAMLYLVYKLKPTVAAFDTETNGLHIMHSTPFLFQFGFIHPTEPKGYTFVVDIQRQPQLAKQVIEAWHRYACSHIKTYLAHNAKYDLHMLHNISLPYTTENISDTMFYIRHAHDALQEANGGPSLKLKAYAAKYIDHTAKSHERLLDKEKSAIAKDLNIKLKRRLAECGKPPEKYNAKSYTISVIEEMFKDPIIGYEDLPEDVRRQYLLWLQDDVPLYLQNKITGCMTSDLVPYDILDRQNVITYGHYDIIYVLEIYYKLKPVIDARDTWEGIRVEEGLIFPLLEMERVGFQANKPYLEESRVKVKAYIQKCRQELFDLTGREFKIGQHELVKDLLGQDFDLEIETTNKDELNLVRNDLFRALTAEGIDAKSYPTIRFIDLLQELRTLEKWYSVYIVRYLNELKDGDRLYTTINQVGAVSGRVTSAFQQFPKDPIVTSDGEELFDPRKMVTVSGGDYNGLVYLDYSQIELRFQAIYTILVGDPDLNLCRAYMPYRCIDSTGVQFDFRNIDHIHRWHDTWYLEEDGQVWTPTDVHGATTTHATGLTPADGDAYKAARGHIGKRVNFAKNYGAQYRKISTMFPEKTAAECHRIDEAYYKAFPGVKTYHNYCYARANSSSYTVNLFGIKYYGVSGHKLINMLVQGSAAYYLKWKIREIYDYTKAHGIKSKFQMNIHDELSWEKHKDELEIFFDFKQLMEDWPDALVPVVAEMDATSTTWTAKKAVHDLNDLQLRFST